MGTVFCWSGIVTIQLSETAEVFFYGTAIIAGPIGLCVLSMRERM
jgi:hypothetical protein